MPSLENRVVVITGAARGIGRATAFEFAECGAHVVLFDLATPAIDHLSGYALATRADLEFTHRGVEARGANAITVEGDVRDRCAIEAAVEQALSQFGRLDVMVANAGVSAWAPIWEMPSAKFQLVLDINLTGVFHSMAAAAIPMIEARGGSIIAVSSIEGRRGSAGATGYTASKWGVIGLVKAAAVELGPYNIRVNAVAPTAVETQLYRSEGQIRARGMTSREEQDLSMGKFHTLPTSVLEPSDVARVIRFLATDEAGPLSGGVIDVAAGGNARYTG